MVFLSRTAGAAMKNVVGGNGQQGVDRGVVEAAEAAVLPAAASVDAAARAVVTGKGCQLAMTAARHLGVTLGRVKARQLLCGSSEIAEVAGLLTPTLDCVTLESDEQFKPVSKARSQRAIHRPPAKLHFLIQFRFRSHLDQLPVLFSVFVGLPSEDYNLVLAASSGHLHPFLCMTELKNRRQQVKKVVEFHARSALRLLRTVPLYINVRDLPNITSLQGGSLQDARCSNVDVDALVT